MCLFKKNKIIPIKGKDKGRAEGDHGETQIVVVPQNEEKVQGPEDSALVNHRDLWWAMRQSQKTTSVAFTENKAAAHWR